MARRSTSQDATTRGRNYFLPKHRGSGPSLVITSVWFHRRGKQRQVYVGYKLLYEGKFRAPRNLSAWLDDKDDAFIGKEVEEWQRRVNQDTDHIDEYFPDFFLKHRPEFLRWCKKTAEPQTIEGYLSYLGRYVFPFFIQRLREPSPQKWGDHLTRWQEYLATKIQTPRGRNIVRTAFRRYLKFLKDRGAVKVLNLPINENERRLHREGEQLPGDLPQWNDVYDWLVTLPAGRHRWVITLCAAFGVRVSEALAARHTDLIGSELLVDIERTNDIVRQCVQKDLVVGFLNVYEAQKRKVSNEVVKRTIGDAKDDPKSGPYVAACSNGRLAGLIVDMIHRKEYEGDANSDDIRKAIKVQADVKPEYPFSSYTPHDFRRLHITLQVFDLESFFLVSQVHGHASEETTKKYYQWGLAQRRKKSSAVFTPIQRRPTA